MNNRCKLVKFELVAHGARNLLRGAVGLLIAGAASIASADLPSIPVFLKEAVPPNLIFTFDVSGSMAWAYVPDSAGAMQDRHFLASPDSNPLAYDPTVSYPVPRKADGSFYANSFNAAWRYGVLPEISGADVTPRGGTRVSLSNAINLSTQYRVTAELEYQSKILEVVQNRTAGAAYYTRLKTTPDGACPTISRALDACYNVVTVSATSGPSGSDELQNFANWYSFWRTRALAAKSGLMIALFDLDPTTRVTWQSFWTDRCRLPGQGSCKHPFTGKTYVNQLAPFNTAKRTAFFDWIRQAESDNSTPLRSAFKNVNDYIWLGNTNPSSLNNPWGAEPGNSVAPVNACRTSYHVAITDGLWNSDTGLDSLVDIDNTGLTLPDGRAYTARAPFASSFNANVADLAFRGWATDASTAANKVWPFGATSLPTDATTWSNADYWNPKNDPANWQHVNTYAVGIGLTESMTAAPTWSGSTFGGAGYASVANGTVQWPSTLVEPNRVHDLWHAAINGRGEFFSADSPTDVKKAFQSIFSRIAGRSGTAGGVSANTTWVASDTAIYTSTYATGDWTGSIGRIPIESNGRLNIGSGASTDAKFSVDQITQQSLLDPSAREIYTKNISPGASDGKIVPFLWHRLSTASKSAVTDGKNDPDIVDYLRGSLALQQGNSACEASGTCKFRKRKKLLGDILGSSPVHVSNQDFGYRLEKWAGASTYQAYLKTKAASPGMVIVGANDGMVHAFAADSSLEETFAYIPSFVQSKLIKLTSDPYVKTSYVDGQIGLGDFYDGSWRTIAVGGLGAGGRGVYAIDASPNVSPANRPMWEFVDADMGQVTSKPVVLRLLNGEWVVLVGGGYESAGGNAVLYSLRASDGSLLQKIVFPNATDACGKDRTASPNNGLGAVSAVRTKDGRVRVFAGDLYGRLWQLSSSSGSNQLTVDLGNKPLLRACNANNLAQPITTAPTIDSIGIDPIVFVGTGKLLHTGDMTVNDTQTFYAVLSDDTAPASTSRTTMYGQRTVSTYGKARTVSSNPINLVDKRGWFIDLPASGERVVAPPTIIDGRVAFTTFVPDNDACITGGVSWAFNLDAIDGSPPMSALFDVNNDGKLSASDKLTTTGSSGGAYASAIQIDATVSSLAQYKLSDRINLSSDSGSGGSGGIGSGSGSGNGSGGSGDGVKCSRGQAKLVAPKLYVEGFSELCTPSATFRSGWRQLR